jgi:hypothetical protein
MTPNATDRRRIMTFQGTYNVMKAERLLREAGIAAEAIAAPRHISTDCGVCIRYNRADEERVRRILSSATIQITGVYDE